VRRLVSEEAGGSGLVGNLSPSRASAIPTFACVQSADESKKRY
jgi:hypothetical protein